MSGRGRKPKPTKLKLLHGNPGKRKINDKEPDPDVCIPDMPDFLSELAVAEWEYIAPKLERLGLLSEIDHAGLAAYCQAYGRWAAVEKMLNKVGPMLKKKQKVKKRDLEPKKETILRNRQKTKTMC